MFNEFSLQPADPLLALIALHRGDTRAGKVDLGVGVYRDAAGDTPVMAAVKVAEKRLVQEQRTKAYVGPEGDQAFLDLLAARILGSVPGRHVAGIQTPGGTSALAVAARVIALSSVPEVHLGMPTWPNHAALFEDAGLVLKPFDYFDVAGQAVRFDSMLAALDAAAPGATVLLHACCHNPSGADLTDAQLDEVIARLVARRLVPLIDTAYLGFADDFEADCRALRKIVAAVPEAFLAVSGSKSFGLYRERVGAIYAIAESAGKAQQVRSNFTAVARVTYSMPPDHGAAVVRTLLDDPALSQLWLDELAGMNGRLTALRNGLSDALAPHWRHAGALRQQRGLFALLPLTPDDVAQLRQDHAIYMPANGRINLAGLQESAIAGVAAALAPYLARAADQ